MLYFRTLGKSPGRQGGAGQPRTGCEMAKLTPTKRADKISALIDKLRAKIDAVRPFGSVKQYANDLYNISLICEKIIWYCLFNDEL